jgi:hypothetical protein
MFCSLNCCIDGHHSKTQPKYLVLWLNNSLVTSETCSCAMLLAPPLVVLFEPELKEIETECRLKNADLESIKRHVVAH